MKNEELKKEVELLIAEVETTHRYSMSRIYGAYNQAYGKDEKPQACASCLIRKVRELKRWLDEQPKEQPKSTKPASATGTKTRRVRKTVAKSTDK